MKILESLPNFFLYNYFNALVFCNNKIYIISYFIFKAKFIKYINFKNSYEIFFE